MLLDESVCSLYGLPCVSIMVHFLDDWEYPSSDVEGEVLRSKVSADHKPKILSIVLLNEVYRGYWRKRKSG